MHGGINNWRFPVKLVAELRSRHSRRMRNPQFYLSGKRPLALVLVRVSFTITTDGIYISLTIMQLGNYPTLRKAIFTQCDGLGPLFGRQIRKCTRDEMMVRTDNFWRHWCICRQSTGTPIVIKINLTGFLSTSKAKARSFTWGYLSTAVFQN